MQIVATLSQRLQPLYRRGFTQNALTRIPDMKILQRQLHKAVEHAQERAERGLLASTQDNGGAKQ